MVQVIYSPSRYIQGSGELHKLGNYCKQLGAKQAYAIVDPYILSGHREAIATSFAECSIALELTALQGECSRVQAEAMIAAMELDHADIILGIGGGKTMDMAKAVSEFAVLPVIVVPTAASTDAACSALSVLYTEAGDFDRYLPLTRSPAAVIADTLLIAKAPPRLLAAGMGDALSTFYEARACYASGALTSAGGTGSIAAFALARACRDTLFLYGEQALRDVRTGVCSPAVEHIVEANIYLSGIGFESGGLAAAHAVHNGLSVLEECRRILHGEKVAFATIVQLVLEQAAEEEIAEAIRFCRSLGLPVTLRELGLEGISADKLQLAAEASCAKDSPMGNMPFQVEPEDVLAAIIAADKRGMETAGSS